MAQFIVFKKSLGHALREGWLTLYQMTKFQPSPNSKHLQATK